MPRKASLLRLLLSRPRRSQLLCGACGYTWYPRGHDVSRTCPNCKARLVPPAPTKRPGLVTILCLVGFGLCVAVNVKEPPEKTPRPDALSKPEVMPALPSPVMPVTSRPTPPPQAKTAKLRKACDAWGLNPEGKAFLVKHLRKDESVTLLGADEKSTAVLLDGEKRWIPSVCLSPAATAER